jgi:hypothetical protein
VAPELDVMPSPHRLDLPGAPARRDRAFRRVSDCLWSWDASLASLDSDQGIVGVFSRAATLASVSDGAGTTYTAPHSMPAWEMRDLDADTVREACGLRMGTSDFLHWGAAPAPQALSGLLDLVETGARTTANATLFAITNDAVSGARLWLDTSGSYYRLNWSDGTTTRTATLTVGQPTSGQRVRLRWTLAADGALALWQSINGAAETTATAAALALPAAWGAGAVVRLNARGDTENPAQGWYRRAKLVAGIVDVALLEAIR